MNERKLRIAEFVESIGNETMSNSVLLGGADKSSDEIQSKTNGECTNGDESCNNSTNYTTCLNARGLCKSTKNGTCDNTWQPKPITNGDTCTIG